jgi:glycosyltransferase involved in cell wall biosynthesis
MMVGLPIVGLATTEMVSVIQNGVNGFISTDPAQLIDRMRELILDQTLAKKISSETRRYAQERFNLQRFERDWFALLMEVTSMPTR